MAWKAPTEPREHKASGRGMIYEPSLDENGNVIRLANGKIKYKQRYFAGKYKSQEMWQDFEQWKRERGLIANGHNPAAIKFNDNLNVTVGELFDAYREAKAATRNPDADDRATQRRDKRYLAQLDNIGRLIAFHAALPCDQFLSSMLIDIQETLVKRFDNSAKTVRDKIWFIRDMFRWGGQRNLCDKNIYRELREVQNPTTRTGARGRKRRTAINHSDIKRMIDAAPPTLRTMLILQVNTGMRSGSLVDLTWDHIDKSYYDSHNCWVYTPDGHKTQDAIGDLHIVIGSEAVEALMEYENIRPDRGHRFIFNPRASHTYPRYQAKLKAHQSRKRPALDREHISYEIYKRLKDGMAQGHELAAIHKRYGSSLQRLRNAGCDIQIIEKFSTTRERVYELVSYNPPSDNEPTWQSVYEAMSPRELSLRSDQYSDASYRLSAQRLAKKLGIEGFQPHRLRHRRNTDLVRLAGIDQAQAVLGHLTRDMTDNYDTDGRLQMALETQKLYG